MDCARGYAVDCAWGIVLLIVLGGYDVDCGGGSCCGLCPGDCAVSCAQRIVL